MKLEEHKKRNPFSTPDGYFEELNRNIIETTCKAPAKPAQKKSFVFGNWTRVAGYAAAIAIVALVTVRALITNAPDVIDGLNSNLAQEEQSYDSDFYDSLLENYTIDDYTFYCYLTEYE